MTQIANINGVTVKDLTRIMRSYEKLVNYFNRKYNHDMTNAKPGDLKEYNSAISIWDSMKAKRDLLTAA